MRDATTILTAETGGAAAEFAHEFREAQAIQQPSATTSTGSTTPSTATATTTTATQSRNARLRTIPSMCRWTAIPQLQGCGNLIRPASADAQQGVYIPTPPSACRQSDSWFFFHS